MALSTEWTEYHLTPRGWIEGTCRIDTGRQTNVETPADRVLTVRYTEEIASAFSKVNKTHTTLWTSADADAVARLREQFGEPPSLI